MRTEVYFPSLVEYLNWSLDLDKKVSRMAGRDIEPCLVPLRRGLEVEIYKMHMQIKASKSFRNLETSRLPRNGSFLLYKKRVLNLSHASSTCF